MYPAWRAGRVFRGLGAGMSFAVPALTSYCVCHKILSVTLYKIVPTIQMKLIVVCTQHGGREEYLGGWGLG